jgi:hypothetical protein
MSELYETRNQKNDEQIDTVGWVFSAVVVIIMAVAAIIAYHGNDDSVVANISVSRVAAPHG